VNWKWRKNMSQTTIFSDRITKASRNIPEVLLDLVIDIISVAELFWFMPSSMAWFSLVYVES